MGWAFCAHFSRHRLRRWVWGSCAHFLRRWSSAPGVVPSALVLLLCRPPRAGQPLRPSELKIAWFPPCPGNSPLCSDQKTFQKKFPAPPRPAFDSRRRNKIFYSRKKPLCAMHNGFFLFVRECFLVFFHSQVPQRPVLCITFRHEFPAPFLHNL